MGTQVGQTIRRSPLSSVDAASFQFNIVSGETFSFGHGFPARPRQVALFIVCITAELGYNVGDKVKIENSAAVSLMVNSINAQIATATLPSIVDADTNTATAITAANWNWFVTFED